MAFFQVRIPELPQDVSLAGQTAIVTGATSGIGQELSLQLLRLGLNHLVIGARSLQKGFSSRLDLLSDPKVQVVNPNARIDVLELDLARYDSVTVFAEKVLKTVSRIDLLILSAGINLADFETTVDGNEM